MAEAATIEKPTSNASTATQDSKPVHQVVGETVSGYLSSDSLDTTLPNFAKPEEEGGLPPVNHLFEGGFRAIQEKLKESNEIIPDFDFDSESTEKSPIQARFIGDPTKGLVFLLADKDLTNEQVIAQYEGNEAYDRLVEAAGAQIAYDRLIDQQKQQQDEKAKQELENTRVLMENFVRQEFLRIWRIMKKKGVSVNESEFKGLVNTRLSLIKNPSYETIKSIISDAEKELVASKSMPQVT